MLIFAPSESRAFGERIAAELGLPLSGLDERVFPDGEFQARPLEDLRGRDVFIVQSLHSGPQASISDKLLRFLLLLATIRDGGARRVTAVMPYLAFARQDQQVRPNDPLALRTVALLLESVGVDAVVTIDVHNVAAFQNAFRCRTVHLEARREFARKALEIGLNDPVAVVSPDLGGAKRAQLFGEALEETGGLAVRLMYMAKKRLDAGIAGTEFAGDVNGAHVLIIDDMISTGTTLLRAVEACREHGARRIHAFATHGLFSEDAAERLIQAGLEKIILTDTVPLFRLSQESIEENVEVVSIVSLFAAAIRDLHAGGI